MITGGCLCGGVRYAIAQARASIQLCHCESCRRAQGTAFAANLPVAASDFQWRAGESLLRDYESSPGKHRLFCGRCGSPLISRRDDTPNAVRVRAGTLDADPLLRPASHAFVAQAAPWLAAGPDLPVYPGARPPDTD